MTSLFKGSIWKMDLLFPFSMSRDYICHFSFVPKLCQENAVVTSPKFQNFVRRVHLWLLLCSMSAFVTSPLFQSQARRPEGGVSIHSHRHTDRKA